MVTSAIWHLPDGASWRDDVARVLDRVIDGLRHGAEPDHGADPNRQAPAGRGRTTARAARPRRG